jgi:PHD/YefM family antitoxin component YafN of YafNO toxin-antitoxin module
VNTRRIPRKRRGQRHQFFDADGVDEVLSCLLRLTAEVSAVSERLYLAERVLEARGIDMASEIERYQFSEADETALSAERQRLIETVLAQLGAGGSGAESIEDDLSAEP